MAEVVATALIQEAVHSATMVVAEAGTQDVARRQQAHVEALAEKAKIQPLCRWNLQEQELAEQVLLKVAAVVVVTEAMAVMLMMGRVAAEAMAVTVAMVLIQLQVAEAAMAVTVAMAVKHTISMAEAEVAEVTVSTAMAAMVHKVMVMMVKTAV